MSRILRLMALCCAALCSQMTFAQPRVIGIDELFRLAEEQSMSIRSFESGAAAAAEGVRAARAARLPDVGVTVSASFLGDGRLWDRSFGEGMKVDIPHFGNNFALEAQQVVYAGGAVRSGIRMAELEQRDAETSLERNRQDICFLLLGHYLNLYKADNRIRVLRENLALTEQVLETMRARREQGTVLQNDITRYELRREQLRLELQRAEDTGTILNHRLVTALHLPEGTEIRPDTALLQTGIGTLSQSDWQDVARENNLDLRSAQTGIGMSDEAVRLQRSGRSATTVGMAATQNNLSVSDAGIEEARVRLENARREAERYGRLLKEDAVTRQQYDNVQTAFEAAEARYEQLLRAKRTTSLAKSEQGHRLEQNEAAIRLAEAAVELARLNLSYTVIVAPCDGVTGRKQIDEGQLVQPGQTLLDVVDSGEVWVTANYRETQLPHIAVGADVEMTVDAVPDVTYHGVVESVSDATGAAFSLIPQDNATGNFVKVEQRVPVRIRLEGNDAEAMSQLRAGLNVECKVRY